jgi:hypothetical protein
MRSTAALSNSVSFASKTVSGLVSKRLRKAGSTTARAKILRRKSLMSPFFKGLDFAPLLFGLYATTRTPQFATKRQLAPCLKRDPRAGECQDQNMRDALELPDRVDEDAVVIHREVTQVIGEAAEIVADADFEVVAEVAVDGGECAKVEAV